MLTISIQCFGVFRNFGKTLSIKVKSGSTVLQVKEALALILGEKHKTLIFDSVLANEHAVLPKSYVFDRDEDLSILPPVCGG